MARVVISWHEEQFLETSRVHGSFVFNKSSKSASVECPLLLRWDFLLLMKLIPCPVVLLRSSHPFALRVIE